MEPEPTEEQTLATEVERSTPDPAASLLRSALDEGPGSTIDRYTLREPIGEGGFGTVWVADQSEPVAREVALKIIKPGMDTREVVARFEAERQALAMMEHPGIAQVFDAGATPMGRPYFVMELVRGEPITDFADRRGLDTRQRLALFDEVCHAVAHAHQKGVIHRDLKPSNILVSTVGDRSLPKVIDFGIAKATSGAAGDDALLTRANEVIGTPLYMSPEQIAGGADIDTRSDVYSLGAVLYELLARRPMFELERFAGAALEDIRRIVTHEDPPRPSANVADDGVAKSLRGEPDWIVMKALEKDRARRYGTADALASDIACHLAGDNIVAAPPTAGYRLRKTLARHRVAFTAGSAVALALVAGLGVALWQASAARTALGESRRSEERAEQARADAEETIAFLIETFEGSDAKTTLLDLMTRAEQQLGDRFADQPSTRVRLLTALAGANAGLSISHRSERLWREALALTEAHLAEDEDRQFDLRFHLAADLTDSRRSEAREMVRELLATARDRYGESDIRTLRCEVQLGAIAMLEHSKNRTDEAAAEAERVLESAIVHCESALGAEAPLTLGALDQLALLRRGQGRSAEALAIYERLQKARALAGAESNVSYYEQLYFMSDLRRELGEHDQAVVLGKEALTGIERLLGEGHARTQNVRQHLAWSQFAAGDSAAAQALFDQMVALAKRAPDDVEALAGALSSLAHFREAGGDFPAAVAAHSEALAVLRGEFPDTDHRVLAQSGALLRAMLMVSGTGDGRFLDEAEALAEKAYRAAIGARQSNPSLPPPNPVWRAAVKRFRGDYAASRKLLDEALQMTANDPAAHAGALGESVFTSAALGDYAGGAAAQAGLIALQPNAGGRELMLYRLGLLNLLSGADAADIAPPGAGDFHRAALTLLAPPGTFDAAAIESAAAEAERALAADRRFPETLVAALGRLRAGQLDGAIDLLKRDAGHEFRSIAAPSLAYLAVARAAAGQGAESTAARLEAEARAAEDTTPMRWSFRHLDEQLVIELALREARTAVPD